MQGRSSVIYKVRLAGKLNQSEEEGREYCFFCQGCFDLGPWYASRVSHTGDLISQPSSLEYPFFWPLILSSQFSCNFEQNHLNMKRIGRGRNKYESQQNHYNLKLKEETVEPGGHVVAGVGPGGHAEPHAGHRHLRDEQWDVPHIWKVRQIFVKHDRVFVSAFCLSTSRWWSWSPPTPSPFTISGTF